VPAGTREAWSPFGLDSAARAELERRAGAAIARARQELRPVLASVTVPTRVEEPEVEAEEEELAEGEELPEGEVPEGAEGAAEPEADAAGEQQTTEG
jgi:hypothetical protein